MLLLSQSVLVRASLMTDSNWAHHGDAAYLSELKPGADRAQDQAARARCR